MTLTVSIPLLWCTLDLKTQCRYCPLPGPGPSRVVESSPRHRGCFHHLWGAVGRGPQRVEKKGDCQFLLLETAQHISTQALELRLGQTFKK